MNRLYVCVLIAAACLMSVPASAAPPFCPPFIPFCHLPPPPPPPHPHPVHLSPAAPDGGRSVTPAVAGIAAWGLGAVLSQFFQAASHSERQLTYAEGHGAMIPFFGEALFGAHYARMCREGYTIYCGH